MSTKQEFYITLPSNVKSTVKNENNTISNYKTILNRRLNFNRDESWTVGLAEISYTKSWFNVRHKQEISFFNKYGEDIEKSKAKPMDIIGEKLVENESLYVLENLPKIYSKCGHYSEIEILVEELNSQLNKLFGYIRVLPGLKYDKLNHYVTIIPGRHEDMLCLPDFGFEIENILGFIDKKGRTIREKLKMHRKMDGDIAYAREESDEILEEFLSKNIIRGYRPVELNAGCNSLYVYSNIVEHSFVGDAYAQLLRCVEVPTDKGFGELVTIIYDVPHLIPLQTNSFDTIELDIKDDTGARIPFEFGRVSAKLIFKRYD